VNADEHNQQQIEQQQYEADMSEMAGVADFWGCTGCGQLSRVTRWTAQGFRLRYGDEKANDLLKLRLPNNGICIDGTVEDQDAVYLCIDCEYHTENWSDL